MFFDSNVVTVGTLIRQAGFVEVRALAYEVDIAIYVPAEPFFHLGGKADCLGRADGFDGDGFEQATAVPSAMNAVAKSSAQIPISSASLPTTSSTASSVSST